MHQKNMVVVGILVISAALDYQGVSFFYALPAWLVHGKARHPSSFPQLPPCWHAEAQERLEKSERQRQWLWSRDYLPTRLLRLQRVELGNSALTC